MTSIFDPIRLGAINAPNRIFMAALTRARKAKAQASLDAGVGDAFAFGRSFLANPDLPRRLAHDIALTPEDAATWYTQGTEGYTDYPTAS
jgi:2,4-dienoyl-CoA reductase-like NADH-dependent reductase (Old Yellow Enzyme family)